MRYEQVRYTVILSSFLRKVSKKKTKKSNVTVTGMKIEFLLLKSQPTLTSIDNHVATCSYFSVDYLSHSNSRAKKGIEVSH